MVSNTVDLVCVLAITTLGNYGDEGELLGDFRVGGNGSLFRGCWSGLRAFSVSSQGFRGRGSADCWLRGYSRRTLC